jgi:hypothetical protein
MKINKRIGWNAYEEIRWKPYEITGWRPNENLMKIKWKNWTIVDEKHLLLPYMATLELTLLGDKRGEILVVKHG